MASDTNGPIQGHIFVHPNAWSVKANEVLQPKGARPPGVMTQAQYAFGLADNEPHHLVFYDSKAG